MSNWASSKTFKTSLGHREMKKRKNQLRPEGSSDKKNCHHLANQPQGAQPASLSPEVWDHPHGLAEAAQPWDQARGAGGGRGRGRRPLHWRGGLGMPVAGCLQPSDPVTFALLCAHLRGVLGPNSTDTCPQESASFLGTFPRAFGSCSGASMELDLSRGKPGQGIQAAVARVRGSRSTRGGEHAAPLRASQQLPPQPLPSIRGRPRLTPLHVGVSFEESALWLKKALKSPHSAIRPSRWG